MPELIVVELPVCDHCGVAGKIPRTSDAKRSLHFFCTGPEGHHHKKVKMEFRTFKEVKNVKTGNE